MCKRDFNQDPHSHYRPDQPKMVHLDWSVTVDFDSRTLKCVAGLYFDSEGQTMLDQRDLTIEAVRDSHDNLVDFTKVEQTNPVVGGSLTFVVPPKKVVWIHYQTSPVASGLQWLPSELTQGKRHPYLFSQGEAIHARSYVPCQDSPEIRFTFNAKITVPKALRALMGATPIWRKENEDVATERWVMKHAVPAYLIALAVGDIAERDITDRCRVYAEPEMIEAAAQEFKDVGRMIDAAEALAGPYDWDRFDMLVLPPSFPYGGMENPCLTFLTPTLITGDGSLVSIVGHELAHSWTGNLITNSRWRDFWLNEGWTVYFEWRINEALNGADWTELDMMLSMLELDRDFDRFHEEKRPDLAALTSHLPATTDPDDIFSRVPYYKGAMFLVALERSVGRERFDPFMRAYINRFRFQSINTATFLDFVAESLPGALEQVKAWHWVYEADMPANTPTIVSLFAAAVMPYAESSTIPPPDTSWHGPQWALYLELLPRAADVELLREIDERFGLSRVPNTEVRWAYLLLALESGYDGVTAQVEAFLKAIGRMKYILPMYKAMARRDQTCLDWAWRIFYGAKSGYHPIAVGQVERILNEAQTRLDQQG